MAWHIIGYTLLMGLAVAVVFLTLASYARVEMVLGTLVIDRGMAVITPSRNGVVTSLAVRDGARVQAGQPLLNIRAEEDVGSGGTGPQRIVAAIQDQDARLENQTSMLRTAARAEVARLMAQIAGLREELASIDQQTASQKELLSVAERDFDRTKMVADRGFLSRRDLQTKEETVLSRRQQLDQLRQARASRATALGEAQRSIPQAQAQGEAQAAGIASSRGELAERLANTEASRGYTLTSPIAGTVTAVTARIGQPVRSDSQLMTVVPKGGKLRAELYVPSQAAGFLAIGQEVRLAVDAFPYQRFGTVTARIVDVASAPIQQRAADGTMVPVYLVNADLTHDWVSAFGRRQPFVPGMGLTARIITEKQSLFRWLFEPLYAVGNR